MIWRLSRVRRLCYFSNIREKIKQQRQSRLGKTDMASILPVKTSQNLQTIRNIGIIAHIDAGKTTSTQRMLYYAGALPSPGQIDEGTTAMDYMPQQRQRGITIRSAAISFNWNSHQINLIDTPGHVDFSAEVTRSLHVLDGAITIIDAVKGVEAQTIKVWDQAKKNKLAKLCFANKMDRIGSSILSTSESIKKRLKTQPLVMQYPIGDGDNFKGLIDLVTMESISFKGIYGELVEYKKISPKDQKYTKYLTWRNNLIEKVGGFDDQILDMYLTQKEITPLHLKKAIKRLMVNPKSRELVSPLFMGSAYRNKGLQPLLNAVIDYLPSPTQRDPISNMNDLNDIRKPIKTDLFTGYVFKMIYDTEKGPLAYTRIYSGILKKGIELLNSTKNTPEKSKNIENIVLNIYRVRANQYVNVNEVMAGDIVAIAGLKFTNAGDTIIDMNDPVFIMKSIVFPSPVFIASLELMSQKHQKQLEEAMKKAIIEDNSIKYQYQAETNQFLVSGLGQLHLQILRDRLVSDGIPVKMGNLKINYKESIHKPVEKTHRIERQLKGGQIEQFCLTIQLKILTNEDSGKLLDLNRVSLDFEKVPQFDECWNQYIVRKTNVFKSRQKESYDTVQEMKAATLLKQEEPKFKKHIRNPTPLEPIFDQEDPDAELEDEPYYHINTLPFQTLFQLVENCKIAILHGKHGLPLFGIQLSIKDGMYKKETFTKPVMNQCAEQLVRQCIQQVSILMEPIMEVNLAGDPLMIQVALKDVMKKRGRVEEQTEDSIKSMVPAEGVRGWIKQLRSMGLQVDIKLHGYEEVQAINPLKLLQENS